MLDIKYIRANLDRIKKEMGRRKENIDLDGAVACDDKRRNLLFRVEQLKAKQNETSKKIPALKKQGVDTSEILAEMKQISAQIGELDAQVRLVEAELCERLYDIPNIPHPSVPDGDTDHDNIEIHTWGDVPRFDFEVKPHWEVGESLNILDFAAAAKITGARFTVYKGLGARLERAVINYFLDKHTIENGYSEILPPYLVNRSSMIGTGQLPKFEEDAFKVVDTDYYLIPTAEVPVTNLYRDCILDMKDLPIKYAAYSACFRAEAGAAGRDTRGLIRQHQFNKVELVKFTAPENSYDELEKLTRDAQSVLEGLGLPYRVVQICIGDLGFTAAKKYDIEVWMPSYNRYVEISSCSNFEDYQARRAGIRFRRGHGEKAEFVHTLNGSGVAVGRTVAAILENYQNPDGTVSVPPALERFMGGSTISCQ